MYDATLSLKDIEEWVTILGDCGWAAACGHPLKAGGYLAVVDRDPRNGGEMPGSPPLTPHVLTGGGGDHFYFVADGVPGSGDIAPGVELKGYGKYIVIPPSVHPSGGVYSWAPQEGPELAMAPLPAWADLSDYQARPDDVTNEDPKNSVLGRAWEAWGGLGDLVGGKRYCKCPNESNHTVRGTGNDSCTVLLPPRAGNNYGGFRCAKCPDLTSVEAMKLLPREAQAAGYKAFPREGQVGQAPVIVITPDMDPALEEKPEQDFSNWVHVKQIQPWLSIAEFSTKKGARGLEVKATAVSVSRLMATGPWEGVIGFDELAEAPIKLKRAPHDDAEAKSYPQPWTDVDDIAAVVWLEECPYHIEASPKMVAEAVTHVGHKNPHNKLKDYLNSLEWDGKNRLDKWLHDYCGAEDSYYSSSIGRMWMISAVARAFKPGCKADYILILEGPQRIGKSTVFAVLGGEWFTDDIGDINGKDAAERLRGQWIGEVAEMSSLIRTDAAVIKAFLSRSEDNYREPYARRAKTFPRCFVLAGTVNEDRYLEDYTGGSRFWFARATSIDLHRLQEDRDQLWAEAVQRFRNRESWYPEIFDAEFRRVSLEEAEKRRSIDPWEEPLRAFCEEYVSVTYEAIYECLTLKTADRNARATKRVDAVMQILGYRYESNTWRKV